MPLETANGLTFHTQELGRGSPAVLIHGLLLGNLASWYLTVAPAIARSHRVLLYDLRGHGLSERARRGYDLSTLSADLDALCGRFGTAPIALVGHSYGGLVALKFAIDYPERVRQLVLVDVPMPPSSADGIIQFTARDPQALLDSLPPRVFGGSMGSRKRASSLSNTLEFLVRDSSLLEDIVAEPEFSDAALARVACPALCLYGHQSPCRPVAARLTAAIPAASAIIVPGGH